MRVHWFKIIFGVTCFVLLMLNLAMVVSISRLDDPEYSETLLSYRPEDTTPPRIVLKGEPEVSITQGLEYKDAGAEAFDDASLALIDSESNVDTSVAGEYTVKYTATDQSGNSSSITRKVTVKPSRGVIYLTFDDGPSEHTARLLDILAKYNVKATFFVTGYGDDEMIVREYKEGHKVALHTYTHTYSYVYNSVDNYFEDLNRIQQRVKDLTGQTSNLIRFPGGSSNTVSMRYDNDTHIMSQLVKEVEKRGFHYFDWNISSGDAGETTSTDVVYSRVTNGLKEGGSSVVLQHDVKGFSVDAVEGIIQYALNEGYTFATLDENSFGAHHGVNN